MAEQRDFGHARKDLIKKSLRGVDYCEAVIEVLADL
jgi:hypothetical protein